ncbi:type I methionyl aminopeptidase [Candidatus Dependentiae bacterium]|nr:type I methionyl aminopeptidase [Candidatus Dependentiae bacterium]
MAVIIKDNKAITSMRRAGLLLAEIFENIGSVVTAGRTTESIDQWIFQQLLKQQLVSQSMGYKGYKHASCISINDEVVHGVPNSFQILKEGDLVKIDVCASWQGYCADMARCFLIGEKTNASILNLISVANEALERGIAQAIAGNRLFDISFAIQRCVEEQGYGVVRDFAGHGIGKAMHEDPDVPNFGTAGTGMRLKAGMAFAIEPMITQGHYDVFVDKDGWTVKTVDGSWAAHVEDTIVITENGPEILTRLSK